MSEGDWDPPDHEKLWVRHHLTGDRGYLVKRGGKDKVRMDRGPAEEIRDYRPNDWNLVDPPARMSLIQACKVSYEADRELCKFIGLHQQSRKEWLNLSEEHRIIWMKEGPESPPLRAEMYAAIMGVLRRYAE